MSKTIIFTAPLVLGAFFIISAVLLDAITGSTTPATLILSGLMSTTSYYAIANVYHKEQGQ